MKVGIIYSAYQTEDYVRMSLNPWVLAREGKLGGHEFVICGVCVPFEGFDSGPPDRTDKLLGLYRQEGNIDEFILSYGQTMKETESRGAALKLLLAKGVDIVWQVDSDEAYTAQDIGRILSFVEANPFIDCFRLSLKNLVFTPDQYLKEPFTPMRIHRTKIRGYKAHHFWADNNVMYNGTITRDFRRDDDMAVMTVPTNVAWPLHWSWLNDERSRRKVDYQLKRWGRSSFRWDNVKGLQFDEAYFATRGQPLPEVVKE